MKTNALRLLSLMLMTSFIACKNNGDDPKPGGSDNLGTFAGNIQVSDDPTTKVGYLYNTKVTITTSGSNATVKIAGTPGFDREFTGKIVGPIAGTYDITLNKQTKPTEKTVGDRVIIINNKLTVTIDIANDNVSAWDNPDKVKTLAISGKLKLIGTDMLKE